MGFDGFEFAGSRFDVLRFGVEEFLARAVLGDTRGFADGLVDVLVDGKEGFAFALLKRSVDDREVGGGELAAFGETDDVIADEGDAGGGVFRLDVSFWRCR